MAILKDLLVNGNSSLLGTTTAVDILPQVDATYDLGSSTLYWRDVYSKNLPTLYGGTSLASGTDLNNIINFGNYYQNNNSTAHVFSNNPYGDSSTLQAFTMKVSSGSGIQGAYIKQDLRECDKGTFFTRYYNTINNGNSWGNWSAYAFNPNTANNVGSTTKPVYVKKNGEVATITCTINGGTQNYIAYYSASNTLGPSNYTFTTTTPTASSTDTTIPTSKAVYAAATAAVASVITIKDWTVT